MLFLGPLIPDLAVADIEQIVVDDHFDHQFHGEKLNFLLLGYSEIAFLSVDVEEWTLLGKV